MTPVWCGLGGLSRQCSCHDGAFRSMRRGHDPDADTALDRHKNAPLLKVIKGRLPRSLTGWAETCCGVPDAMGSTPKKAPRECEVRCRRPRLPAAYFDRAPSRRRLRYQVVRSAPPTASDLGPQPWTGLRPHLDVNDEAQLRSYAIIREAYCQLVAGQGRSSRFRGHIDLMHHG